MNDSMKNMFPSGGPGKPFGRDSQENLDNRSTGTHQVQGAPNGKERRSSTQDRRKVNLGASAARRTTQAEPIVLRENRPMSLGTKFLFGVIILFALMGIAYWISTLVSTSSK